MDCVKHATVLAVDKEEANKAVSATLASAVQHCPPSERLCAICGTKGCLVLAAFVPHDAAGWRTPTGATPGVIWYGLCSVCNEMPDQVKTMLAERGILRHIADGKAVLHKAP